MYFYALCLERNEKKERGKKISLKSVQIFINNRNSM